MKKRSSTGLSYMNEYLFMGCLLLTLFVLSCFGQEKKPVSKTVHPSKSALDTPACFVRQYQMQNDSLFAFVGEKISLESLPRKQWSMDECFKATYRILQRVYGRCKYDTVEFIVYDHYGLPAFSDYKTVLLFVTAEKGTIYHEKYMFNDVYKTTNGRWAGSYTWDDYKHNYNKGSKIKPEKIDFAEPVFYIIDSSMGTVDTTPQVRQRTKELLKEEFPTEYYRIEDGKAIPIYGNYVEELVQLKRDGYLKARSERLR